MADDFLHLPKVVELYYNEKLPTPEVACRVGISKTNVKRILKKSGYILRNPSEAMKLAYEKGRATAPRYERTSQMRQETSERLKEYYSQHPHPRHKGCKNPKLGEINRSLEHRQAVSKKAKERFSDSSKNPMYGKHHSEETKAKLRQKTIRRWQDPAFIEKMRIAGQQKPAKMSIIQKANWQKPEYRAKVIPACLKSRRPTDLERKLINLITKYSLPYKYTGDGSFTIGRLNPDFVNVNGDKIAIEVFGGHWHQNSKEPLRTEEGRRAILKEYGWELIVIWGHELKSLPEEAIIARCNNG